MVEQLDTMHHRAAILQDFIAVRVAERLNGTMVLLSIVAGVFLPLSFVTGLLGMTVTADVFNLFTAPVDDVVQGFGDLADGGVAVDG